MKVVCYPKCSTCKKALVYLENLGIEYDYRDIKEENPSYEELKTWYEKSGLE
ncbi:MAG: arsenate reductase family protein, partial [Oscillospiraceae bacterium]|nr:arsenate reductase family protein [Oscillospiraceae bacterium]